MVGTCFRQSFTLIELLIVVAIIGILAAIAIPNFLEAQTRAKVSRTMADMRTCATAYEMYHVDHNWIPWDGRLLSQTGYCGTLEYLRCLEPSGLERGIGWMLTTPISYLTSIPMDPFNSKGGALDQRPHNFPYEVVRASVFCRAAPPEEGMDAVCTFVWQARSGAIVAYRYAFESIGPDLIPWPQNSWALYYDPTNGTISDGDIVYLDTAGFD